MSLTDSNKKKNYSNVTNGNTKVAELPKFNKTKLHIIRQIGNKAGSKNFPTAKQLLDSKQKPAKVITLKPNKDK